MRSMGLPEEAVFDALRSMPSEDTEIWPWQQNAVDAFYMASTQWRWASVGAAMGGLTSRMAGMDYASARIAWRMSGIRVDAIDFDYVRVMEAAVISGGSTNNG